MADTEDTDGAARWQLARPALGLHAALGFLLFLAVAPLLPGPPEGQMNPQTTTVVALGGSFMLGVLLVIAATVAGRLARGPAGGANLLPSLVLGLAGPIVFGLAGSSAWGLASFFVAREIGAMIVLPALLAGAAAPAIGVVCAGLFLFEQAG